MHRRRVVVVAVDRSLQCVLIDRWDEEALEETAAATARFRRSRSKLGAFFPTGAEAANDVFWALLKAAPRFTEEAATKPSHRVNRMVLAVLSRLGSARRLRRHTVGDPVLAALATVDLQPTLEGLFDRLRTEFELAQRLAELMQEVELRRQEVDSAEESLSEAEDDEDATVALAALEGARGALAGAEDDLAEIEASLDDALDQASVTVEIDLGDEVAKIADTAERIATAARAWGLSSGDLQRLPAAERFALAQQLDTPRLRAIAELFGRLEAWSTTTSADQTPGVPEEMFDMELGGHVDRLVPSELLLLGHPVGQNLVLQRVMDREALQYAMRGQDDTARGGIVVCIDGSGSMRDAPERFAKALMLVLINQAKRQGREISVIVFGGPGTAKTFSFQRPEQFTADGIMAAAETFFGGGTDFETPMDLARQVLAREYGATGRTSADVVFVTDDECKVTPETMGRYLDSMREMGARTWGVFVGRGDPHRRGALAAMAEGRLLRVQDLTSSEDLVRLLSGVR
jgi:uncharacterized protein with von Willebrand factor type A (vWA) domain